ncbi:DUF4307 domain-containing protein [Pseudolysinimonas sp.]|jgi:Domain of unknown function (DUF4307)
MVDSHVATRYGRTEGARRRNLVVAVAAALAVLVAVVAWVIWVGLFSPKASLESRDVGYVTRDADSTVDIRFEITTDPGTPVSCALQALNDEFAIVGWKVVDLPGVEALSRAYRETVRVTEPAVTGLIYRCWLT